MLHRGQSFSISMDNKSCSKLQGPNSTECIEQTDSQPGRHTVVLMHLDVSQNEWPHFDVMVHQSATMALSKIAGIHTPPVSRVLICLNGENTCLIGENEN